MLKPLHRYQPYAPALLTLVGAIMLAVGLLLGSPKTQFQELIFSLLRFGGSIIAATGAFWSGHRQVRSAAANRERDQKLLSLSEELRNAVTGGDAFCYGYPSMISADRFQWNFIHQGRYPLFDVSVRIHNCRNGIAHILQLGTLFPGRAHIAGLMSTDERQGPQAYNLFFLSRNGSWTQEIRWVELPGVQATANRVVRDGGKLSEPLLLEVSTEYPAPTPADQTWSWPS
jgi:hypothetical protein